MAPSTSSKITKCPLELSKELLHTSILPDKLLDREEHCTAIRRFIVNGIKPPSSSGSSNTSSHVMYISGVPGTGKTASVLKVINDLRKSSSTTKFLFSNINGLELSDPKQLFAKVYKTVNKEGKKNVSPKEAHQYLNGHFLIGAEDRKRQTPVVILIDEVDMLYTKREEVIYTVFNWSAAESARCCVIAISNTLDLAERKFSQRVVSRMGSNKLVFQPYEFPEIERILKHRIRGCPAIGDKTIELTAKKVASISGDLRKAFELMRRAIDLALEKCEEEQDEEDKQHAELRPEHILDAIVESTASIRMEFVQALSRHEELLFRALVADLFGSALEDTDFSRVLHSYKRLCASEGLRALPLLAAFDCMKQLALSHLVILSPDRGQLHCPIKLGFPVSEAQFCLRQLDLARNNQHQAIINKMEEGGGDCSSPHKSASKSPHKSASFKSPSSSPSRRRIAGNMNVVGSPSPSRPTTSSATTTTTTMRTRSAASTPSPSRQRQKSTGNTGMATPSPSPRSPSSSATSANGTTKMTTRSATKQPKRTIDFSQTD